MSINDIQFSASGSVIYDPLQVASASTVISVTNYGDSTLTELGLYIVPATEVGDVDFPADFAPETDYEDLLTWGTYTVLGLSPSGGLFVTVPTNSGIGNSYISRNAGSTAINKIEFQDLAPGETTQFTIKFETPSGEPARRFFIDLKLE